MGNTVDTKWEIATSKIIAVGPWVVYLPTACREVPPSAATQDRGEGCICELCHTSGTEEDLATQGRMSVSRSTPARR
jgi:hypothetical protein